MHFLVLRLKIGYDVVIVVVVVVVVVVVKNDWISYLSAP